MDWKGTPNFGYQEIGNAELPSEEEAFVGPRRLTALSKLTEEELPSPERCLPTPKKNLKVDERLRTNEQRQQREEDPGDCPICHRPQIDWYIVCDGLVRCSGCGSVYDLEKGIPDSTEHLHSAGTADAEKLFFANWIRYWAERNRKLNRFISYAAFGAIVAVVCTLLLNDLPRFKEVAPIPERPKQIDYGSAATALMNAFLKAESLEEKVSYVRDPIRVAPLMSQYYARSENHAMAGSVSYSKMGYSIPEVLPHGLVSHVSFNISGIPGRRAAIEHTSDGPKLEWESLVVYSDVSWDSYRDELTTLPQNFRVAVAPSDRLVGRFTNAQDTLCFRLTIPGDYGEPVYAYTRRNSREGEMLENAFVTVGNGSPQPFILTLSPVERYHFFHQAEIKAVVQKGWRKSRDDDQLAIAISK